MIRSRFWRTLLLAGLLLFFALFLPIAVLVWSLPSDLTLLIGESGSLRVGFPLSLVAPERARGFLAGPLTQGTELAVRAAGAGEFQVEVRLFGSIPLRQIAVSVVPERRVVPGGDAIGVLVTADGVVVVGHQPLRGLDGRQYYPAKEAGIEAGDIILSINNAPVHRAEDMAELVARACLDRRPVMLGIRRAGRLMNCRIDPVVCRWPEDGSDLKPRPMLGLFVEDPTAGVGTLTFYDPITRYFAALGHRINQLGDRRLVWLEGGKIVAARISGIECGARGKPGEKIGTFSGPEDIIGTIGSNSTFGLFGRLSGDLPGRAELPVALAHQVHTGPATIRTVIQGTEVQEFKVEIIRVYQQSRPHDKGLVLKVTDPYLLSMTGGIVQGMSGSPIIQDGRLAGAVTHVFINDPTRGYGVLAQWMLQEMENLARAEAA